MKSDRSLLWLVYFLSFLVLPVYTLSSVLNNRRNDENFLAHAKQIHRHPVCTTMQAKASTQKLIFVLVKGNADCRDEEEEAKEEGKKVLTLNLNY